MPIEPADGRKPDLAAGTFARPIGVPVVAGIDMAREASRYVYWLQLVSGYGPKSKAFGVTFECAFPSTSAIERALRLHGIVNGTRLDTTDDGKGGRLIRSREAFMFGVAGLITLQPYNKPCWEPEE